MIKNIREGIPQNFNGCSIDVYFIVLINTDVIDAWDFECDWEFDTAEREVVGTVTATSTEQNDAGPGNSVTYDILENEFTGYGQGDAGNQ